MAGSGVHAGIASVREPLLRLEDVSGPYGNGTSELVHGRGRIVIGVVIDQDKFPIISFWWFDARKRVQRFQ
jgi:hypothetical protein